MLCLRLGAEYDAYFLCVHVCEQNKAFVWWVMYMYKVHIVLHINCKCTLWAGLVKVAGASVMHAYTMYKNTHNICMPLPLQRALHSFQKHIVWHYMLCALRNAIVMYKHYAVNVLNISSLHACEPHCHITQQQQQHRLQRPTTRQAFSQIAASGAHLVRKSKARAPRVSRAEHEGVLSAVLSLVEHFVFEHRERTLHAPAFKHSIWFG